MTKPEMAQKIRRLTRQLGTSNRALKRWHERILPVGRQMSNLCFNACQREDCPADIRETAERLWRKWDKEASGG